MLSLSNLLSLGGIEVGSCVVMWSLRLDTRSF